MTGNRGSAGGVSFRPIRSSDYSIFPTYRTTHLDPQPRGRKSVGQIGSAGENGGQFHGLHMIATDSKGNIYTGEVYAGERVQKFVPTK